MKLGYAINTISSGAGSPWCRNEEGGWTKYIGDLRTLLNSWSNPQKEPVDFVRFVEEGFLLVSIQPISGRPNDLCSYYFFVPRLAQISGKELLAVVSDFIAANGAVKELEEIVAREFPQRKHPAPCKPSSAAPRWAMRYYDDREQLETLLGAHCYQNYYDEFNAIFLLKKGSTLRPAENSQIVDVSGKKLLEMVTLLPPSTETLQKVFGKRNVEICFKSKSGELVKLPSLILQRGQTLQLFAVRKGFEPVKCMLTAEGDYEEGRLQVEEVKWICHIRQDKFVVNDRNNPKAEIENIVIKLNGRTLPPTGLQLNEEECVKCAVSVTASGYEEWTPGFNPPQINILSQEKIVINLVKKSETSRFTVELADNTRAEIKLRDNGGRLLKGYYRDNYGCYHYNGSRTKTMLVVAFMAGIIFFAAIWAISGLFSGCSRGEKHIPPEAKIANVADYFESHNVFSEKEIADLDTFNNMFELMNTFDVKALEPMFASLSDSSKKAKDLLALSKHKFINPDAFTKESTIDYSQYKETIMLGVNMYKLLDKETWNLKDFKNYKYTEQLFNILNDGTFSKLSSMPQSLLNHPKVKPLFDSITYYNIGDYKFSNNGGHYLPQKDNVITIGNYWSKVKPSMVTNNKTTKTIVKNETNNNKEVDVL